MNKKTIFQIVLIVLLLGGGIYLVTQFFKPAPIQILCDIHPPRVTRNNSRAAANPPPLEIAFGFDQKYELTDLKVVARDEWTTNQQAHPLWHLVSESNSVPTKAFLYGQRIQGMHAAVAGARREPLQTNVTYRMLIVAGARAGECDFKLPALPPAAR
ncbi:MAG TPA: hypothetical protein VII71_01560 [Verrucomicrobiae bacterium]